MKFALLLVLIAALWPLKTLQVNHQSLRPLIIQVSKTEPPRIALREVLDFIEDKNESDLSVEYSTTQPVVNLNEGVNEVEFADLKLKAIKISKSEVLIEIEKQIEQQRWLAQLPKQQQQRIIQAQNEKPILEEDWSVPSWQDWAENEVAKVKQEISQQESQKQEKVLVYSPENPQAEKENKADVVIDRTTPEDTLVGAIQLQGLPSAEVQLDIFREEDFQRLENGTFDLGNAKYQIRIHEKKGHIRGILTNNQGKKIGEGRISLASVDTMGTTLVIYPKSDVAGGSFASLDRSWEKSNKTSSRARGEKIDTLFASTQDEVKTDTEGRAEINNFSSFGWTYVRTASEDFAPTITLLSGGADQQKTVLRKGMVQALKEIIEDQKLYSDVEENGSVVWGQVTLDGKPQAGVSVFADEYENHQTVYFNALMLPDLSLKGTTTNGYFAILNLPDGAHNLSAKVNEVYFAHENIIVETNVITTVEMKNSIKKEQVTVRVFDAFSGEPETAKVDIQSLDQELSVQGHSKAYLPAIRRLGFAMVTPEDPSKMICLHAYSDDDMSLLFPIISEAWLRNLKANSKISDTNQAGIIVGFVPQEDFEVALAHEKDYDPHNIVFFDSRGNTVSYGLAGGGFVMFNVPYGTQAVTVNSTNQQIRNSQIIPVDQGLASVVQFRFY